MFEHVIDDIILRSAVDCEGGIYLYPGKVQLEWLHGLLLANRSDFHNLMRCGLLAGLKFSRVLLELVVDGADLLYRPSDHPRVFLRRLLDRLVLQLGVEEVFADGFIG